MRNYIQRPLVWVAFAGLLGSVLGMQMLPVRADVCLALSVCWLGLAVWRRYRPSASVFVVLATVCLYTGLTLHAVRVLPNSMSVFGPRRDITVQGPLRSYPSSDARKQNWRGILKCEQAWYRGQVYPVSGNVSFTVSGELPEFNPGDRLEVRGTLQALGSPMNPGEFDFTKYWQRRGVYASLYSSNPHDASCLQPLSHWALNYWLGKLRRMMLRNMNTYIPAHGMGMVWAMVTGERAYLTDWQKSCLANAGLAHLVAVSGMNVGIVYLVLLGILRIFKVPRLWGMLISIAGIGAFAGITGGEVSVVRACIMLMCVVFLRIITRTADSLSGLALAGLVLLCINPAWCYDAGAQLSFVATLALVFGIKKPEPQSGLVSRVYVWGKEAICTSGVVLLFTSPLTLYHFNQCTPIALFSNLVAVPLSGLIVVCGLVVGIGSGLCPGAAHLLGTLCAGSGKVIEMTADLGMRLPWGVWYGWSPPVWLLVGYYLVLAGWYACPQSYRGLPWLGSGFLVAAYLLAHPNPISPGETRFTFLSLGIGEAALVETTRGEKIMIDAGTEKEFFWRVKPFLASRGIQTLDALILSHTDNDHAGGLKACLTFFKVKQFIHGNIVAVPKGISREALDVLKRKRTQIISLHQGDEWQIGKQVMLHVLWPPAGQTATQNEYCLAFYLVYPGGKSLFTGDCPDFVERTWEKLVAVDSLKVGHHGDKDASDPMFLAYVCPKIAVLSPGNRNTFGFPDQSTVVRLQRESQYVLNTAEWGAVEIHHLQHQPIRWCSWQADKNQ